MVVQIDTREKPKAIEKILEHFGQNGIQYVRSKLICGDYARLDNPMFVVDRKQNLSEVASNFSVDERRFVDEMKRANSLGIRIVFLVEHSNRIKSVEDVRRWNNPRLKQSPLAISGDRIYRKMLAYQNYYGVRFEFCDKEHTGREIVRILNESERTV